MPDDQLQAAVDRADDAIRALVQTLPAHPHLWSPQQHARYVTLLAAFNRARADRDAARQAARAREGEQEPEAVAA